MNYRIIKNGINDLKKTPNAYALEVLFSREPDRIRTCDRLLRRQMLYPAELRVHKKRGFGSFGVTTI